MRAVGPNVVMVSLLLASLPGGERHLASAQTSQDRAATVLAAARAALGGDTRIAGVKSFIAAGRTRQVRGNNLIPIEFEIQAELPDRYARRDEFPAQDNGPVTVGFNGDALVQNASSQPPSGRAALPPPAAAQQEAAMRVRVAAVKQDFARLMLGMFASSFSSFPLTFSYVAQAEAPQGNADVLDVMGPENFRSRLFISSETHLPILLTWQAPVLGRRGGAPSAGPAPGGIQTAEQRMYFADYRAVDGLQLPFRIRRAIGTDTTEETTFDRFRVNVRVDPKRFQTSG